MLLATCACITSRSARYEDCDDPEGLAALEQARQFISNEQHEAAIEQLRLALARCPDRVRTHLLYVEAAENLSDQDGGGEAVAEMHRYYLQGDEDSPVWPYMRARLAKHDADRQDQLEQAIELDAAFHWAYLSLARLWRKHGRLARALTEIDRALFAHAKFPEARLERAEVLAEVGRYREAAAEYENYLRLHPGDRSVSAAYAHLLIYELGLPVRARAIIDRQLEDDPENVEALMDLAAIAWKERDLEGAVERYREVLRLDQNQELAVLNLGNLHYDVLWRRSETTDQRTCWLIARKAYLYYLGMTHNRATDKFDFFDHHLAVPHRLRQISEYLGGEYEGPALRIGDF